MLLKKKELILGKKIKILDEKLKQIKYWVIDVDGTMTDAGIYYDDNGNEIKKFCTKDAAGYFTAHAAGMDVIVLTGRESPATTKRLTELGVQHIFQDIKNKKVFLESYMADNNIMKEELAYIGDDLNDLPPMKLAGFVACPADACAEIKQIADYISPIYGGHGAVRDCIEYVLRSIDMWDNAISKVYDI